MRNDTKVDKHSARLAHVACLMLFKLKRSVESTRDVTDVIQCIQTWLTEQETGSLIVLGVVPLQTPYVGVFFKYCMLSTIKVYACYAVKI